MSTGVPVVAACMQAPSFRVNCSSSNSSAVGSVAHRVSRDTVAVSMEITAPSTSSPVTQARQIRSATACASTPSSPPASSAWVTVPSSAIAAALSGDAHIEFSHGKLHHLMWLGISQFVCIPSAPPDDWAAEVRSGWCGPSVRL